jgi:hypothetical protein
MYWRKYLVNGLGFLVLGWALSSFLAAPAIAQQKAEKSNMELVGYNDLQGRGAYQPLVKKQGERWIAYVGAQTGTPKRLNPLTGQDEFSGTSIVDVTDPKHPKYLFHIPGEPRASGGFQPSGTAFGAGRFPPGEAEFMRVCGGGELPHADKSKFYMLRVFGHSAWQMWDVTDPAKPIHINDIVTGLTATHRPVWECDTGTAFLPAGLLSWPVPPPYTKRDSANHLVIYDLSDPTKPVLMRDWGLPGQNPGTSTPYPRSGLHYVLDAGSKSNRVYITYGNDSEGVWLVLDRDKLLKGPKEPTDENLRYPLIAKVDMPPDMGAHTPFPLLRMELPEFAKQAAGKVRDFLVLVPEQAGNECQPGNDGQDGSAQLVRIFDITTESRPLGVATWWVPEASGNFCSRGGRFGPHASNEEFNPIYYKRVLFVTYFNAGLRALDIRDPYHPKEIAYYIPAVSNNAVEQCAGEGADKHCRRATQTNNVTVDDRGYIYIVDHDGSGMHILELTGAARQVADFSQVGSSASLTKK